MLCFVVHIATPQNSVAQTDTTSNGEAIKKEKRAIEARAKRRESLRMQQQKEIDKAYSEARKYDSSLNWHLMRYTVENGDTLLLDQIKPIFKFGRTSASNKNKKAWKEYRRLVYNFKIVYPYALQARRILYEADSVLAMSNFTPKEREQYINDYQKRLFKQFEKPMRKLTISQGKLLLKLIDRELGRTSFYIIREYRGRISAGFWQTVAKIFGNDLKKPYDKFGEDRMVEDLIVLYNAGAFDGLYYSMFRR